MDAEERVGEPTWVGGVREVYVDDEEGDEGEELVEAEGVETAVGVEGP
jgi:hypothetical protein